jgi:hypothetical protein
MRRTFSGGRCTVRSSERSSNPRNTESLTVFPKPFTLPTASLHAVAKYGFRRGLDEANQITKKKRRMRWPRVI